MFFTATTSVSQNTKSTTDVSGHSMDEFLRPMRNFQIIIRLEERCYLTHEAKAVEVPFRKALDYLKDNDVPIQIFSKSGTSP